MEEITVRHKASRYPNVENSDERALVKYYLSLEPILISIINK